MAAPSGPEVRARFGPYEPLAVLGAGGFATVHRARRRSDGAEVALKVLHSRDPAARAGFRREARLLGLLRHPGVVSVYDQALEAEEPWCAMELVPGAPLDSLWRAARPPLPVVLDVFATLSRTLAFVHGEGIVHRDLKPENVLLRPGGGPVLVDFGLGARFSGPLAREDLEAADGIVGSFTYMAPEQAAGAAADARADLYALGCMLYEALTGAPPFSGSPWELIEQHRSEMPEPPSRGSAPVSPDLERLVLALLAKEPRRRPGYAEDVARALERLGARGPGPEARPGRPYLYRPGFVGREHALQRVEAALARAREGRGSFLLVLGESGAGKTRLALEATRVAVEERFAVSVGSALALEGRGAAHDLHGTALHPLRPFFRDVADYCQHAGPAAADRVLPDGAGTLVAYEPALAGAGEARPADPAILPARAARERLLPVLGALVRNYARERRLILVLDDLQWGDDATLELLATLPASLLGDAPLVILALCRREEIPEGLRATAPHVERIELDRLDPVAVGGIAADMLATPELPSSIGEFLADQSEGNPFFVAEYLRSALDAGWLVRQAGTWRLSRAGAGRVIGRDGLGLPEPLRALLRRRIDALGSEARVWLEAAAVLGRAFEPAFVDALAGGPPPAGAIEELLRREILEEGEDDRLRFAHDKLREAVYEEIEPARRRLHHESAAERLEARGGGGVDAGDLHAALAHHWAAAGFAEHALPHFGAAGEHALQLGAHRDAAWLLARALEIDRTLGGVCTALTRARWERLRGEAFVGIGDLEASLPHALSALRAASGETLPRSRVGWAARIGREVLRVAWRRGRGVPPARSSEERALRREASLASGQAATTFYFRSEVVEALASSLACVRLAEEAGAPALGALAAAQLAYVAGSLRLDRLARSYFALADREECRAQDPNAHAAGMYFHAMSEMGVGRWAESEALGLQSLTRFEEIGNWQEAEVARTIVANTRYFQGRLRESEALARELLESATRRWNAQHTGWGLFLCGRVQLALGRFAPALDLLERGYAHLTRVEDEVSTVMCEGLLALACLRSGDAGRAFAVAESLRKRLARLGTIPLAQCLDGYESLAVVVLELRRAEARGIAPAARQRAERDALRALGRFAWMFPIARPAAERARALRLARAGRLTAARRHSDRALALASRLGMVRELALAHAERADFVRDPGERSQHVAQALALGERLGCAPSALGGALS
jgi:tetratricopeptide (TPR) repeat protein